jgi:hypothetical protein
MSTEINPYAAPKAVVADVSYSADPQAEAIRRAHINHEASIRSIGTLYYVAAFVTAVGALGATVQLWTEQRSLRGAVTLVMFGLLTAGFFLMGRALRALQRGVRTPTIILACVGLLGFPIGTLINAYLLYLVLSKKGRFIFSPEYAEIVEATPHIKYRTSLLVWIILGLIVALMALAILVPMLSR